MHATNNDVHNSLESQNIQFINVPVEKCCEKSSIVRWHSVCNTQQTHTVCVCVCTVCIRLRRIWWCLMVVLLANCMHFTSKWQSTAESIVCHWKHILVWDNLFFKYSIVIHYNFIKSKKFYKSFESVLNYVLCVGHKLLPLNAPVSCCFRYIQPMDLLHVCVFFSCSHFIFIV